MAESLLSPAWLPSKFHLILRCVPAAVRTPESSSSQPESFPSKVRKEQSFQVNDAEKEKIDSAKEHKAKSEAYRVSEVRVQKLYKALKRSIAKSR